MEVIYDAVQTVAANQNVLYNTCVTVNRNKSIYHRNGSGLVSLKGCSACGFSRFKISFNGNIAVPTGGAISEIDLAVSLNGETVGGTTAAFTPAAVEEYGNVHADTYIDIPSCCCGTVSVKNISAIPIEVRNANLIVERVV